MKPCKRLEIVIDAIHAERVFTILRAADVQGYTLIPNASGWGHRGSRVPDGVSGAFENCVILCACDAAQVESILGPLRPALKQFGGIALLSDAHFLSH